MKETISNIGAVAQSVQIRPFGGNEDGSIEEERTFRYVIKERIPSSADKDGFDSKSGIQYDTKERYATVTLKLVDNKLEASVAYDGGEVPVFTNTNKPPTPKTTPPTTPPTPKTKTGDYSNVLPYVIMLLLSICAIAALLLKRKREN